MERVKFGELYWFIEYKAGYIIEVNWAREEEDTSDETRYLSGNYFATKEEAESMAKKLRAVLKGAEVIEMPSEEEILSKSSQLLNDYYDAPAELCAESLKEWLKSKIVK